MCVYVGGALIPFPLYYNQQHILGYREHSWHFKTHSPIRTLQLNPWIFPCCHGRFQTRSPKHKHNTSPPRGHLTCQFSRSPKIHHHATVSTAGFSESTTNNTAVGLENAKPIKCTRDLDLYCVKIVGLGPHGWKGVDEATSWKGEIWNMWTAFSRTIGGLITHSLALWHFSTVHTPKVQHVRASAHNRMELSSEFMTNKEPFPASPSTGGWCNNNN